jgi:FkbM family methyltransferase
MNYDFIEVGTSDFETHIQNARDETVGLSIEPIQYYLDRLPNKENVEKLNCAVSFDGKPGRDKVYYIPHETIVRQGIPHWIRGCNSMGDYHYQHKVRNLQEHVKTIEVDVIPLRDIFEHHNVEQLKTLKLDTEGGDSYILQSFIPFLKDRLKENYPQTIEFETNILTPAEVVNETIELYVELGYRVAQRGVGEQNTILAIDI